MRQRELVKLIAKLGRLTSTQRDLVVQELSPKPKLATVEVIERAAPARPPCPHCGAEHIVKNGRAGGLPRFLCRTCSRTFNILTGTPLAHLHLRGKWLDQAEVLRDELSLTDACERLNVARTTAFRWRHRFLAAPKELRAQLLTGVAETDETYFLRSCKGQRGGINRPARKRGGKATKRGLSDEQVPVLVARDRSGATADFILDVDDSDHIVPRLRPILAKDVILCTEGNSVMMAVGRKLGVEHHAVNVAAGVRVRGAWHVQNVNSYHSRLKGWMRQFRGVATKYLDSYLGWFRAIERSARAGLNPASLLAESVTH